MKRHILIFHIITIFQSIANNLAHPVTPTFIYQLQLRDAMFGLAFSAMSLGIFLFSIFWGELSNNYKKTTILLITMSGYGVGQFLFMQATGEVDLLLSRLLAGFFAGGFQVASLNYLVTECSVEERGTQLTYHAILLMASSTIGYFVGGLVGDYSVKATILLQIVLSIAVGVAYYVFLNKHESAPIKKQMSLQQLNPIQSIMNSKKLMTPTVFMVMLAIFMAWLGSTSFDQSFNYYLRDVFGFKPSYNGYLKIATGIIGIIGNFTLGMFIIKKTNIKRSYSMMLIVMVIAAFGVIFAQSLSVFLIFAVLYIGLDSISKPIQQTLVSSLSTDANQAQSLMGLYNSMKGLGMIGGAFIAGIIYESLKIGPFILASICVLFAAMVVIKSAIGEK